VTTTYPKPKSKEMNMKTLLGGLILAALIPDSGCSKPVSAGPNGGDLVPIKGGNSYAELVANAETGEVMVHTWDQDLKTRRPIEEEPITVGSGENSVELTPHPMDADPSGRASRFYGEADWLRGGEIRNGWMRGGGVGDRREFAWQRCWQAGRRHGHIWEEMGKHRNMGQRHGPGHHGGRPEN
jgi:hypothetical protein